jgi:hypothetical protein
MYFVYFNSLWAWETIVIRKNFSISHQQQTQFEITKKETKEIIDKYNAIMPIEVLEHKLIPQKNLQTIATYGY